MLQETYTFVPRVGGFHIIRKAVRGVRIGECNQPDKRKEDHPPLLGLKIALGDFCKLHGVKGRCVRYRKIEDRVYLLFTGPKEG